MKNDPRASTSDADFIRMFEQMGPEKLARKLGVLKRNVYGRREVLERTYGRQICSPDQVRGTRRAEEHARVLQYNVENGKHLIAISSGMVGHTSSLISTMAHEIIHVHERNAGMCRPGVEHTASFKRWAAQVCKVHGFDPMAF